MNHIVSRRSSRGTATAGEQEIAAVSIAPGRNKALSRLRRRHWTVLPCRRRTCCGTQSRRGRRAPCRSSQTARKQAKDKGEPCVSCAGGSHLRQLHGGAAVLAEDAPAVAAVVLALAARTPTRRHRY